jgi:four helix bundle protein
VRSRTLRFSSVLRRSPWLSIARVSTSPRSSSGGSPTGVRRASKSICANLAEGWGRRGFAPADFRRFVVMAVGSADEMRVWTRYCLDLGYIDEAVWRLWCDEYTEISKMLQGLRKALEPSR